MPVNSKQEETTPYIRTDNGWQRILLERDIGWIAEKVKEALERSGDVPDLSKRETKRND